MKSKRICQFLLILASVIPLGACAVESNYVAPPRPIGDQFVLGAVDNRSEMDAKLNMLVAKNNNDFKAVDALIRASNPELVYFQGKENKHFYRVTKQRYLPIPHTETYGIGLKVQNGKIIEAGCSRSSH